MVNCYSIGVVTIPFGASGLVGGNTGSITGCFWDIETSDRSSSDGGVGKTTAQMMTLSTFTDADWNFDRVWRMCVDGSRYPQLD